LKILVTGGSGYIGSELIRVLKEHGNRTINYDVIADVNDDIRDAFIIREAVSKSEVVYHLASPCIVQESLQDPARYWDHIYNGTKRVVEACIEQRKRLIFTSTQLAADSFRCKCCGRLQSPYAEAKSEAEKLVETLPDHVIVRLPNIYDLEGKDPNESRLFPRFNKQARENGVIRIYPPEDTLVTLIQVDECARKLLDYLYEGRGTHLMKGETFTIRKIVDMIASKYGARVEVIEKG
jgi:nucleoside-diphosphate-sugar epimerase